MNADNKKIMKLSEVDQELVGLVAVGLRDDEIATQLQIPQHTVVNRIARLLAKLGAQDRVEIVLYAYSDPTMRQRISSGVIRRTPKIPQAQTPSVKRKVS
jgi:DNA-binding NarL/FixJ family response regulator